MHEPQVSVYTVLERNYYVIWLNGVLYIQKNRSKFINGIKVRSILGNGKLEFVYKFYSWDLSFTLTNYYIYQPQGDYLNYKPRVKSLENSSRQQQVFFFWNLTLFKVIRKSENRAKNGRIKAYELSCKCRKFFRDPTSYLKFRVY